jgi:hypothetical protein
VYYPINGGIVKIDEEDLPLISCFKWHSRWSKDTKTYYARHTKRDNSKSGFKSVLMHRLIMKPPTNMEIDHINHDTLDNRRSNLKIVTTRENGNNRSDHGIFPVGSSYHKRVGKFQGYIRYNGRLKSFGYFIDHVSPGLIYDLIKEEM